MKYVSISDKPLSEDFERFDEIKDIKRNKPPFGIWGSQAFEQSASNPIISEWHQYCYYNHHAWITRNVDEENEAYVINMDLNPGTITINPSKFSKLLTGLNKLPTTKLSTSEQLRIILCDMLKERLKMDVKHVICSVDSQEDFEVLKEIYGHSNKNPNILDWHKITSLFSGFELTENGYRKNNDSFDAWDMASFVVFDRNCIDGTTTKQQIHSKDTFKKSIIDMISEYGKGIQLDNFELDKSEKYDHYGASCYTFNGDRTYITIKNLRQGTERIKDIPTEDFLVDINLLEFAETIDNHKTATPNQMPETVRKICQAAKAGVFFKVATDSDTEERDPKSLKFLDTVISRLVKEETGTTPRHNGGLLISDIKEGFAVVTCIENFEEQGIASLEIKSSDKELKNFLIEQGYLTSNKSQKTNDSSAVKTSRDIRACR
ncbi:MAG: hypothetical protein ACM3KR_04005 [Deltaproteobacteria bacterium]